MVQQILGNSTNRNKINLTQKILIFFVAMFVLHVNTFKAHALFALRSRVVKKPYGASLKYIYNST